MTMQAIIKNLPVLGLGASLSLSEQPEPLQLCQPQFDHDQADNIFRPQFVEYAGLCDFSRIKNDLEPLLEANIQTLFHPSFINFCGSFENSQVWLDLANQHIAAVKSPWFAQDCAYCFWQEAYGYSSQFGFFMPPILNAASLEKAIERVKEVQAVINVPLAIEPPPVTFSIGQMPMLEFFTRLSLEADCALLLDVGHLVSYQMATGQNIIETLDKLPLDRVIEVHIAGGEVSTIEQGPIYIDAHHKPIQRESWAMLKALLPLLPNLKAVCFECEGIDSATVFAQLSMIKDKLTALSINPDLVNKVLAS